VGEKLAWWLGITKPKFLYEIEEYKRMKKEEEEEKNQDEDQADEIVIGPDGQIIEKNNSNNFDNSMTELSLFSNSGNSSNKQVNLNKECGDLGKYNKIFQS
jgi:hypothetical protein